MSERSDTINEVGSIYTIQGFDLNYDGVIIGESVVYDNGEIKIKTENNYDSGAMMGATDFENPQKIKEKISLNALNVLLKRGIKGLYIMM